MLNPQKLNACPHCGGVNGYKVTRRSRRIYRGSWGVIFNKLTLVGEKDSQAATCVDCKKPFEIKGV